jgi:hypothetical protein
MNMRRDFGCLSTLSALRRGGIRYFCIGLPACSRFPPPPCAWVVGTAPAAFAEQRVENLHPEVSDKLILALYRRFAEITAVDICSVIYPAGTPGCQRKR